jgi:membrane fusion protein, multidrug efflux system
MPTMIAGISVPRGAAGAVLLLPALLALGACKGSGEAAPANGGPFGGGMMGEGRTVPVAAVVATSGDLRVSVRGTAHLKAREEVEVLPKQGGTVSRIVAEEGARVAAGAPLAVLDDQEWRLQARQAEARAKAARDAAERGLALQAQGLLADQEVERLRSDAEVAAADHALARLRVENAVIRAPIAGTVTHRFVERGQLISTQQRAFSVADLSRLEAVLAVPEREAHRIQVGQAAQIRIEGGAVGRARVARMRPVVDATSGTVQTIVDLDPTSNPGFRPGQFVNVEIVVETLPDRITLPRTSIRVDGPTPRIFVVRDGRATEVDVALGTSQGELVEIRSGVTQGDTVVVVGQDGLRGGVPVRLVEIDGARLAASEAPAPAAAPEGAPRAAGDAAPREGRSEGAPAAGGERPRNREELEARLRERGMSEAEAKAAAERILQGGGMGGRRPGGGGGAGGRP